jgi:hypothetical protein
MAKLFNRDLQLVVGGVEIKTRPTDQDQTAPILRVTFEVTRTLKPEPNTAKVTVYNLSEDTRGRLGEDTKLVELVAGHVGNTSKLFQGDINFVASSRNGPDWLTSIEAKDGGEKFRKSRSSVSFKPGVKFEKVVGALLDDLGLSKENALKKLREGGFRGGLTEFAKGFSGSGQTSQLLEKTLKSAGLGFSIQDGEVVLLKDDEGLQTIVSLDVGSGLIGSPEIGEKGVFRVRSLITEGLTPGNRVNVKSMSVEGVFRIERTVYSGDTMGQDWYADLEMKRL